MTFKSVKCLYDSENYRAFMNLKELSINAILKLQQQQNYNCFTGIVLL